MKSEDVEALSWLAAEIQRFSNSTSGFWLHLLFHTPCISYSVCMAKTIKSINVQLHSSIAHYYGLLGVPYDVRPFYFATVSLFILLSFLFNNVSPTPLAIVLLDGLE